MSEPKASESCQTLRPAPVSGRGRVVVIGIGNRWRSDDGVGPAVAAAVRRHRFGDGTVDVLELDGDAARLVDAWAGADLAVVVDAVRSGAPAGTVRRYAGDPVEMPAGAAPASSHGLGLREAIGLGRAVGRMPERFVVIAVEGATFADGTGLSPAVGAAVPRAARLVIDEVGARRCA
jgi:hydrogenase maturation protease